MGANLLKRWRGDTTRLPFLGSAPFSVWVSQRDHHCYLITFDPSHADLGFRASYKDARAIRSASRFIPDLETGYPDLLAAQTACEADVRRLLGRLS